MMLKNCLTHTLTHTAKRPKRSKENEKAPECRFLPSGA